MPLTVAYVALTIALTAVFSHAKKHQYCEAINKNSNSKRTGDRIFLAHFIFLQLCIVTRLILTAILTFRSLGYFASSLHRVWLIRLLYNSSVVFLCVAYGLQLYTWVFIIHRVHLYGGVFSVEEFRNRFKLTRRVFISCITALLVANLIFTLWEVAQPMAPMITKVNATVEFIEYFVLLVCFAVTGPMLVNKLEYFYEKNYKK